MTLLDMVFFFDAWLSLIDALLFIFDLFHSSVGFYALNQGFDIFGIICQLLRDRVFTRLLGGLFGLQVLIV